MWLLCIKSNQPWKIIACKLGCISLCHIYGKCLARCWTCAATGPLCDFLQNWSLRHCSLLCDYDGHIMNCVTGTSSFERSAEILLERGWFFMEALQMELEILWGADPALCPGREMWFVLRTKTKCWFGAFPHLWCFVWLMGMGMQSWVLLVGRYRVSFLSKPKADWSLMVLRDFGWT